MKTIINNINDYIDFSLNIITIATFFIAINVNKKINNAVDREKLASSKDEILGTLNAYIRKMESKENCNTTLINELKFFLQDITETYPMLNSYTIKYFISRLNRTTNYNFFKIRKTLLKFRKTIERNT
ncbi:hypothetical protein [Enterococcus wangshanyuanii]|uniref:Uncharacterized protein n=1 Tax=Enterococcus wangshanyuanii TaxID=2005703 RepID=A0ABQ1NF09_9ENTE|nr:hypothetical protein [Enterococcus wangshanyuanii]GGC75080.1 hypothetical protein GCM10011573_00780 [Enterococcus wangshanyuanii]